MWLLKVLAHLKIPELCPKSGTDYKARAASGSPAIKVSEAIPMVAWWARVQGGPGVGVFGREPGGKWVSMCLLKA